MAGNPRTTHGGDPEYSTEQVAELAKTARGACDAADPPVRHNQNGDRDRLDAALAERTDEGLQALAGEPESRGETAGVRAAGGAVAAPAGGSSGLERGQSVER